MLRPLNKNVLIQCEKEIGEAKTPGGLFIPSTAEKSEQVVGKVAGMGPEVSQVTGGDKVLFDISLATKITTNGQVFFLMKEEDLLAIVG